jgi:STE24 endopeptidase
LNEDKASRYQRLKRRTAVLSLASTGAVLALLMVTGWSARLRDLSAALSGGYSALTIALYVSILAGAHAVLAFPLAFYDAHHLERRYGLSSASRGEFARQQIKGGLLNLALALAAVEIVYATIRAWPAGWWIVSAGLLACCLAALAGLAPVLLLPLFYQVKPLERRELQDRLTELSRRAGVPVLGVYEWGLGERTRRANAALVGGWRMRRMLVSDTMLAAYSDDEIEVILAHELGHHANGHLPAAVLAEAASLAGGLAFGALALRLLWRPLGLLGPSDVAGLPLLLMAGGAWMLLAAPAVNLLSRHHERRADRYALALTGRPAAFVSAVRRLGAQNLAESNPSRLAVWLFHTHPPVEQRIAEAHAFAARDPRGPVSGR